MAKIYDFENIEPKAVLGWFKKICSVPHGSFKEKQLSDLLKFELEKFGCETKQLSTGALYVKAKATYGHDNWPIVLLQGHLDMVHAKDDGISTNLDTDPVPAYYDTENKWLKAEGTTLGADNGVALAMFCEVLTNPKIEHGPIEALFTTGEEVNPIECMNSIPSGLIKAQYYINLDSDHDNCIYYASAGVYKVGFEIPIQYQKANKELITYEINLKNFSGGHSALTIHNPHINPIVLICRALLHFSKEVSPVLLVTIDGGIANNSIPTNAKFVICINPEYAELFEQTINKHVEVAKVEAQNNENSGVCELNKKIESLDAISVEDSERIFSFFAFAQNNMLMPSKSGCMFNSSNIGKVETKDNKIISAFLPRSFFEDDLKIIAKNFELYAKYFGCQNVTVGSTCACWLTQNHEKSKLINLWKKNYKIVTGEEPLIVPNPGGLEVAELVERVPQLMSTAMSGGPIIFKEHSTFENCPIESIKKIWNILTLTLKELDK